MRPSSCKYFLISLAVHALDEQQASPSDEPDEESYQCRSSLNFFRASDVDFRRRSIDGLDLIISGIVAADESTTGSVSNFRFSFDSADARPCRGRRRCPKFTAGRLARTFRGAHSPIPEIISNVLYDCVPPRQPVYVKRGRDSRNDSDARRHVTKEDSCVQDIHLKRR